MIDDLLLETQDDQLLAMYADEVIDDTVYDWNADIPAIIQQAAQAICTEYEGLILTSIAHIADSSVYIAWYDDPTLHPDDDGHVLFREFRYENGVLTDTTFTA